jgi:integrase
MPPGLSPKTIKNIHGVLHQALEKAVDLGYIRNNASDAAVLPRIEKKEMQFLQSGETAVFLKACESHHLGALFMVYVLTGVRKSELLGLTWDCVDRESGTLLINKQWKRTSEGLRFTPPKNGKARYVTPPATVFQLLKKQKAAQGELRLKAGAAWNNDNNLVFTNDTGGGRDGDSVYKRYKTFLKNNGLPDLRLHDLRHTSATLMLESGMNYKAVSEQLGHSTPAFTLQQYGHVTAEARRENAQKMEDKLAAIMAAQNL